MFHARTLNPIYFPSELNGNLIDNSEKKANKNNIQEKTAVCL